MSQLDDLKKQVTDLGRENALLTNRIIALERMCLNMKGAPIIEGYQLKKLVLNDTMIANQINTKINNLETRIAALEAA